MSGPTDIVVVVLAGGEGRRMGGSKPLRAFGTTTLIGRALELAKSYADAVAIAVRDPAQVAVEDDTPRLVDNPRYGGPIAGLASALDFGIRCGTPLVLTLPCDTPRLPGDLAMRLQVALAANADVAMAASGGRLHPTCALWRADTARRLSGYVTTGSGSLRGFAEACGMVRVDWSADAGDPFANANTPGELQRLQPVLGADLFLGG